MVHGFTCGVVSSKEFTEIACGGASSLTLFALMVLIELEALESGTTSYEFVGELGLVVWVIVAPALGVDLVVGVLRFI